MSEYVRVVCVTANIDSLGENEEVFKSWVKGVVEEIGEQKPQFAAIHLQGLHPRAPARIAQDDDQPELTAERIFKKVTEHPAIKDNFETSRGFFDTEYGASDFTGLGAIYLIRDVREAQIWNASNNTYSSLDTRGEQFDERLSRNPAVIRGPFPDKINPNRNQSKSTATGFLVTKWKLFDKVFTFINVNLFTNPKNDYRDMRESVNEGALVRQDQIQFILQKLEEGDVEEARLWLGTFNTELDRDAMVKDLSSSHRASMYPRKNEQGEVIGQDHFTMDGMRLLTVEENKFDLGTSHDWLFGISRGQMVKKYNREVAKDAFNGLLHEATIFFPPTCYYSYDKRNDKDTFLRSQCPAWADRIFFNRTAANCLKADSFSSSGMYYGIIGENVNVGVHKPVVLHGTMKVRKEH